MGKNTSDDWLTKAIEEWYRERGKAKWGDIKYKISPSGAHSLCPREIQLKLLGYKSRFDGQQQRRMDNGTKYHERQEEVFIEMGLAAIHEERFETDDVSGKPDITIARVQVPVGAHWDTDDLFMMELKSVNTNGWRKLPTPSALAPTNMAALVKVRPDVVLQWLLYDQLLLHGKNEKGEALNLDIGKGFIFFECKDSQAYQYYYVVRDDALRERLAANAHTALAWNRKGMLIGAPFPKTSPTCRNCDLHDICFREQDGDPRVRQIVKDRLTKTKRPAKVSK
jgi:hypothetical protein